MTFPPPAATAVRARSVIEDKVSSNPSRNITIVFEVQDAAGCPVYAPGDKLVFRFPFVDVKESKAVCAHVVSSAYPLALALSKGVAFEELGEGKGGEGIYYCPGGIGRRVVFAVSRKSDEKSPSITIVMTKPDKDVEFIITHLKKLDMFSPLPEASIHKMIPALELKRFPDATPIITQGEPGKFLFILIKGTVDVMQKGEDGFEKTLATLSKGEVFGEMSLISGEACAATVKTSGPISVLAISKENFQKILDENPSLNIYFNRLLVQRLRKQNVQVDEELSRGVLGKLSMITLPELAQTLSMNSRTGTLVLYNASARGEVFFSNGQVFDARVGEVHGEEAFYQMLTWSEGNFRFKPGSIEVERSIRMETMGLLMEGLRRMDETTRTKSSS